MRVILSLLTAIFLACLPIATEAATHGRLLEGNDCLKMGRDRAEALVTLDQRVVVRDGVSLSVDVIRPVAAGRLPTILQITPYGASALVRVDICRAIAARYAIVVGYSRGTARSEGRFRPGQSDDGRDGYDLIQWIARQTWSDEQVVMVGGSYQGMNQWQVAALRPPQLKAIAPRALAGTDNWLPTMGTGSYHWLVGFKNEDLEGDDLYWARKNIRALHEGKPLADRAAEYGADAVQAENVRQMFDPAQYDAQRQEQNISSDTIAKVAATGLHVLSMTGYYDNCYNETVEVFDRWQRAAASPSERANHQLLIGPWPHDLSSSQSEGGLRFEPQSQLDLDDLTLEWFEHILRNKPAPAALLGPITYYETGLKEGWHSAASLAAMTAPYQTFYLAASAGYAERWDRAGALQSAVPSLLPLSLHNDPRRVTYLQQGQTRPDYLNPAYLLDPAALLAAGDKLVFASAPMPRDTMFSGRPLLTIWGAIDVPDMDLTATLYSIEPDGRTILLGHGMMRARYNEDRYRPSLVKPEEVRAYHFDFHRTGEGFSILQRSMPAGTRFALVIRPPADLTSPWNYQTGGVVGAEDARRAKPGTFRIFQAGVRASRLDLPLRPL